jgi:hypothetical protein
MLHPLHLTRDFLFDLENGKHYTPKVSSKIVETIHIQEAHPKQLGLNTADKYIADRIALSRASVGLEFFRALSEAA